MHRQTAQTVTQDCNAVPITRFQVARYIWNLTCAFIQIPPTLLDPVYSKLVLNSWQNVDACRVPLHNRLVIGLTLHFSLETIRFASKSVCGMRRWLH